MGLNYIDDYELTYQDQVLIDDDMIIDNSAFREPIYDVHVHIYIEDEKKVNYVNKAKSK
jgi:hypothetical protein